MEPGGEMSGGSPWENHQEMVSQEIDRLTNEINELPEEEQMRRISDMEKELGVAGLSRGETIHKFVTKHSEEITNSEQ